MRSAQRHAETIRAERREAVYARLAEARPGQRDAFDAIKGGFAGRLRALRRFDESRFLSAVWKRSSARLSRALLPVPPFAFLNQIVIKAAMTAGPDEPEKALEQVRARFDADRLDELLMEDWVGLPPWPMFSHLTSTTQLRHLNDLLHFSDVTGCGVDELKTVVEWGGGYGGMAKLFRRWGRAPTYILIDFALVSCVQWLYLTSIFGAEAVYQITEPGGTIRPGMINLVPVALLDGLKGVRADLFLSTFALDESSAEAQARVFSSDWFGAERLLVAFDERLWDAARLRRELDAKRAIIEKTSAADGSHYAYL